MSFRLAIPDVPPGAPPALDQYLRQQRTLLLFLIERLNTLGADLHFDEYEQLTVKAPHSKVLTYGGM